MAFAVADTIFPGAKAVVAGLQVNGIQTCILSGDNEEAAKVVVEQVGTPVTNVIAGVLPHEKALGTEWLRQVWTKRPATGAIMAMTGDGVNDTAVSSTPFPLRLVAAQTTLQVPSVTCVGIAICPGSDVALSTDLSR